MTAPKEKSASPALEGCRRQGPRNKKLHTTAGLIFYTFLVMEQPDSCERHHHAILISTFDDCIISHGTTGFCNVGNTALVSSLDIVGEWEEGI